MVCAMATPYLRRINSQFAFHFLVLFAVSQADGFAYVLERENDGALAIMISLIVEDFEEGHRIFDDANVNLHHEATLDEQRNILSLDQLFLIN